VFRELTRKKQQLTERECVEVLKNQPRGVLSVLGDDGYPYGMPMNFYYDEETGKIWFHGGKTGHKMDALKRSDKVSFCVYDNGFRREGEWALNIKSVIVFGRISLIDEKSRVEEISRALSLKYTEDTTYIEKEIRSFLMGTICLELTPDYMTGKLVNES